MARPQRPRRICEEPAYDGFSPDGIACGTPVLLSVDEYEVIRLVDLEAMTHEQCAAQMDISRTTVTEIYESARRKIAECLVNGRRLVISGGQYRLCGGAPGCPRKKECRHRRRGQDGESTSLKQKGMHTMRIAVTYENGNIFQHFGHTEQFKFYDVEDQKIVQEQIASAQGSGHGALAGFLTAHGVNVLICGGIGGGAQSALAEAGIQLFGGASGSADEAVAAWLAGSLRYDPDVRCDHHGHEHHGGSCGEDKHGCHGSGGCGQGGCGHA